MMSRFTLTDGLGSQFSFQLFSIIPPNTVTWYDVPGLYAFIEAQGFWGYLIRYVGECDSFCVRLVPSHEKFREARERGMCITHVAALVFNSTTANRKALAWISTERNLANGGKG